MFKNNNSPQNTSVLLFIHLYVYQSKVILDLLFNLFILFYFFFNCSLCFTIATHFSFIVNLKPNNLLKFFLLTLLTCLLSCFSHVRLFATPWTESLQAPLSMEFSRQEHWSGLPFPSAGNLPDPGTEPASLASPALAGSFFIISTT